MDSAALRLVVITTTTDFPALGDEEGWGEASRLRDLMQGLDAGGYRVEALLPADANLPDALARLAPDMVIVDAASGARDAVEHVVWATRESPRPIVLFTEEHDPAHMRQAVRAGVTAYVVAGLQPERVRSVVDVALARFEHEQTLLSQRAPRSTPRTRRTPEQQRVVDEATTLLMQRLKLDERAAYAQLRSAAMREGRTVESMATRVIDLGQLLA